MLGCLRFPMTVLISWSPTLSLSCPWSPPFRGLVYFPRDQVQCKCRREAPLHGADVRRLGAAPEYKSPVYLLRKQVLYGRGSGDWGEGVRREPVSAQVLSYANVQVRDTRHSCHPFHSDFTILTKPYRTPPRQCHFTVFRVHEE